MTILRDAVVAHQNPESFRMQLNGNFAHCRVIGATRAANGKWGWPRRIAYGVAVPGASAVHGIRLVVAHAGAAADTLGGTTIVSLPVAWAIFAWSSFGEGLVHLRRRATLRSDSRTSKSPSGAALR